MLKLNLLKSEDINGGHSNITKVGIVIARGIAVLATIPIVAFVAGVCTGLLAWG